MPEVRRATAVSKDEDGDGISVVLYPGSEHCGDLFAALEAFFPEGVQETHANGKHVLRVLPFVSGAIKVKLPTLIAWLSERAYNDDLRYQIVTRLVQAWGRGLFLCPWRLPMRYLPNAFQTPNFVVDDMLRLLDGAETKVVLYAIRQIIGWNFRIDTGQAPLKIESIRGATGLSRPAIIKALRMLTAIKFLTPVLDGRGRRHGTVWYLNWEDELDLQPLYDRIRERRHARRLAAKKRQARTAVEPHPQDWS